MSSLIEKVESIEVLKTTYTDGNKKITLSLKNIEEEQIMTLMMEYMVGIQEGKLEIVVTRDGDDDELIPMFAEMKAQFVKRNFDQLSENLLVALKRIDCIYVQEMDSLDLIKHGVKDDDIRLFKKLLT